jgi:hypothetical protein
LRAAQRHASRRTFSAPNPAPVRKKLEEESHGEAAKEAIKEKNLTLAGEHVDALLNELTHAQDALKMYDRAVETQTLIANHAIDDKNQAISDADSAKRRYHRLKFPACVAGAAVPSISHCVTTCCGSFHRPTTWSASLPLPPLTYGVLWDLTVKLTGWISRMLSEGDGTPSVKRVCFILPFLTASRSAECCCPTPPRLRSMWQRRC